MTELHTYQRDTIFISKATPGDDEFALWLATRLEGEGYRVFADILNIHVGDEWRRKITDVLRNKTVKMLLCCSNQTLGRRGVTEEIGIAEEVAKKINDENFILPLRLRSFNKVFGIGELQYINFEDQWSDGLDKLLESLNRYEVPKDSDHKINPNWATYQRRQAVKLEDKPEILTTNWLSILSIPDKLLYIAPSRPNDIHMFQRLAKTFRYPIVDFGNGFITFATATELNEYFKTEDL